jgi:hypothetical protein
VLALCGTVRSVRLVDHHKTAMEDMAALAAAPGGAPANLHATLDMARSGASLARDEYDVAPLLQARLGAAGAARVLRLYSYVEDNDLWRHALPGSRACAAGLAARALPYDAAVGGHAVWEALLAADVDALQAEGGALLEAEARAVAEDVARAERVDIPWGPAVAAEAGAADAAAPAALSCLAVLTQRPDLRSPLGNALAAASAAAGLAPAGAVVYVADKNNDRIRGVHVGNGSSFTFVGSGAAGSGSAVTCCASALSLATWKRTRTDLPP